MSHVPTPIFLIPLFEQAAIPYRIRHSQRAKRLQVVFHLDCLELVLPRRTVSPRAIEDFLALQGGHICQRWHRLRQQAPASLWPAALAIGARLPCAGAYKILVTGYLVDLPDVLWVNDARPLWPQIYPWYLQEAERAVLAAIAHYAPLLGRSPEKVRIRSMKGAWGTCTPANHVHFNWLLIAAPPIILSYVVVHELCHLFFRDHSVRFWNCVAQVMPDYRTHVRWLKQHGAALRLPYEAEILNIR